MYKLINGWTKSAVLAQIKKYNNNRLAWNILGSFSGCVYQAKDGNRCAVGCFIPNGHDALVKGSGDVRELIRDFPDLQDYMPFEGLSLQIFQSKHDDAESGRVYEAIEEFLEREVE